MPSPEGFRALRPYPRWAPEVATQAFESIHPTVEEQEPERYPYSYLRAVHPALFAPPSGHQASGTFHIAARHLDYLKREGVIFQESEPSLYVYRQAGPQHAYTGIVGLASTEDYQHGRIKKHEQTQVGKEEALVEYFRTVGHNGSPVLLAYQDDGRLESALRRIIAEEAPEYDFYTADHKRHQLWPRSDPAFQALARASMGGESSVYIADGHHRCAAAARWAQERPAGPPWFMAMWLSTAQINIHTFNRMVSGMDHLEPSAFVAQLRAQGLAVQHIDPPTQSILARQEMLLWIKGHWFHLTMPRTWIDPHQQASQLEVTQLQDHILKPLLGIADTRTDPRLDYAYGAGNPSEIAQKAVGEGYQLVFFPPAIAVHQMIKVADAGATMPPKSTWIEPKLLSGLLIHALSSELHASSASTLEA